jgi:NADH:ubiquinone reductase (non-electrogenic)
VRTARKDATYIQASCVSVDPVAKTLLCEEYFTKKPFNYAYDKLVIAVGAESSTWGVKGVREFALTLSSLSDARAIRNRIMECFERASNPFVDDAEKSRLLHFVVCGGGPTSIEFSAELYDFLQADVSRWYPDLQPFVRITLIEASNVVLGAFKHSLRDFAMKLFKQRHIEVLTKSRVTEINESSLTIMQEGNERSVSFGLCVWSAGVGPNKFTNELPFEKKASEQSAARA